MNIEFEFNKVLQKCKDLPPAKGFYLEGDFICNLLLTVIDFQMHTNAVIKAMNFYREKTWHKIRDMDELKNLLAKYGDDKEGNICIAQYLWGYKLWTRVSMLRKLVDYFESIGVTAQDDLKKWAETSDFQRDFKGKVPGLGFAVYKWLIMRQGVETVKPDVHLRRFTESIIQHTITDEELVNVLEKVASHLGLKAYELDWRIWEYQRNG